ncbi:MAG: SURF1 family protein [Lysobacterales bacterium]
MKPRPLPWAVAAFALAAFFVMLGQWQLGRAREKELMLVAVGNAERRAPNILSGRVAPGPERPVRIAARGHFDAAREVLLDNQSEGGKSGVRVLTLFRLDGAGSQLLIDRGWLVVDPVTRMPTAIVAPPAGSVDVRGLLTALPGVGVRMGDAAIDTFAPHPLVNYLDQQALRDAFGPTLIDGLLRLDPDVAGGFSRKYQPVPVQMPPARHRGYALQWFALAGTVLVTWLLLAFRRK